MVVPARVEFTEKISSLLVSGEAVVVVVQRERRPAVNKANGRRLTAGQGGRGGFFNAAAQGSRRAEGNR